jgi:hypothetical protein
MAAQVPAPGTNDPAFEERVAEYVETMRSWDPAALDEAYRRIHAEEAEAAQSQPEGY